MDSSAGDLTVVDIADLEGFDEPAVGCGELTKLLIHKGFAVVGSSAISSECIERCLVEAQELHGSGGCARTPEEVLSVFLGKTSSAWTAELPSHTRGYPEHLRSLGEVDRYLGLIGQQVAASQEPPFPLHLTARSRGRIHLSKMPEDRSPPKLVDVPTALTAARRLSMRKLSLLYILGSDLLAVTLHLHLHGEEDSSIDITVREPIVVAYCSDVCSVTADTEGFSLIVQVDFVTRERPRYEQVLRLGHHFPAELHDWFDERFRSIVGNDLDEQDAHYLLVKRARQVLPKMEPVRVMRMWCDLPQLSTRDSSSFQAALLRGLDTITCLPMGPPAEKDPNFKWDHSVYYEENGASLPFKVYTRHMGVLDRGHDPLLDFDACMHGVKNIEDIRADPRQRLLSEASMQVLRGAGMEPKDTRGQPIGFFCGLSANAGHLFGLMGNQANPQAWLAMSSAALVNRQAAIHGTIGVNLAFDTEDASGACAVDAATESLRLGRSRPCAVVVGCHHIPNPLELVLLCNAGFVSRCGRSKVLDESCDGFVRSEAVVSMLLALEPGGLSTTVTDGALHAANESPGQQLIYGTTVVSHGHGSTLTFASSRSIYVGIRKAGEVSGLPHCYHDAIELSADGRRLLDTAEAAAFARATHQAACGDQQSADARSVSPVALRATKANYGNAGPASGCLAIARTCALLQHGVTSPTLHLHKVIAWDQGADSSRAASTSSAKKQRPRIIERLQLPVEALSMPDVQSASVASFGTCGTYAHVVLHGAKDKCQPASLPVRKPLGWPQRDLYLDPAPEAG